MDMDFNCCSSHINRNTIGYSGVPETEKTSTARYILSKSYNVLPFLFCICYDLLNAKLKFFHFNPNREVSTGLDDIR